MSGLSLQLDNVTLDYGTFAASLDLSVEATGRVAVTGASGSGKSTLLNLIAGFERPDTGRILVGGRDITMLDPASRPVSMVFQENNLFGHLTIAENIGLGRSPRLKLTTSDHKDIEAALEKTGLAGKGQRRPSQLSGGERQRAALARVLVRDRPILLLDEPFASLGPGLRSEMLQLLTDLQSERQMTLLMITHHPEDAIMLGGKAIFLEAGRIVEYGDAAMLFGPEGPVRIQAYTGKK